MKKMNVPALAVAPKKKGGTASACTLLLLLLLSLPLFSQSLAE
jgi:biotin transporter BioY